MTDGMWFQVLSLLIGVPCVLKGAVGLTFPGQFYRWREGQYTSDRPPTVLLLASLALVAVVAVKWYATLAQYTPWGWIVTAFVTTAATLGAANLIWWRQHQGPALRTVVNPTTRRGVDLAIVGIWAGFVAVALAVY